MEFLFLKYCAILVAVLCLSINGCTKSDDSAERELVREALRKLAPEGGTGVKTFAYPTGELKEKFFWKHHEVESIEYYDTDGVLLYTAVSQDRQTLCLTLGSNGQIEELYQATDFVKDGYCFVFRAGRLHKIQKTSYGEVVSEVAVAPNSP